MRKSSPKAVSDILQSKEFEPINNILIENEVVRKFSEIFPDLKKIAKAKKISNKTLFLRVQDSVWRSELNFHKETIIEEINKHFKKEIVKNIRFI